MTDKCPICEEGELHDFTHTKDLADGGIVPLHYSVCSACGSQQANAEQAAWNKRYMMDHLYLSSLKNRSHITKSDCRCFHCFAEFQGSEITKWADRGKTALCPKCGVDAVVNAEVGNVSACIALNKEKFTTTVRH